MLHYKRNKILKNEPLNYFKILSFAGAIAAVIIAIFVLFQRPMPGVADQGDFQRVMSVTGLKQIEGNDDNYETHWYKYVTTRYKIDPLNIKRLLGITPTTSMIYPIALVSIFSRLTGSAYFNTRLLAVVYAMVYITSLYICLRSLKFKKLSTALFFTVFSIFILMDGNYLIWFNSLYGEPLMIAGLLLFTASMLYVSQNIENKIALKYFFVFIAAILFLGAKMQCFSALPFMAFIIFRAAWPNRRHIITAFLIILILFVNIRGIYKNINSSCGLDTQYNSVFYGILKNSQNPEEDLKELGLSPELAVEAGKHAYLPKSQYVKYVPLSQLTINEFNNNMSNLKLMKFYIAHPIRLIRGMEYTASKSFDTRGSLGKYEKADVKEYTYAFKRFTLWSDFRSTMLPKRLLFLGIFYSIVIFVAILEYLKRRHDREARLRIELLLMIIFIGLMQFPMPYIGNGEADTAKQLFLFNYTFDIVFLCACAWAFDRLYSSPCKWELSFNRK